jgi:hypothetical protein
VVGTISAARTTMRMYINGVSQTGVVGVSCTGTPLSSLTSSNPVYIGPRTSGNAGFIVRGHSFTKQCLSHTRVRACGCMSVCLCVPVCVPVCACVYLCVAVRLRVCMCLCLGVCASHTRPLWYPPCLGSAWTPPFLRVPPASLPFFPCFVGVGGVRQANYLEILTWKGELTAAEVTQMQVGAPPS